MLKVAHFSDLHYAGATLIEVDRCFGFAVDTAIRLGVQCAVITGDATDHALDMHSPAVSALARQVRRLADHCPVLLLQGTYSHEPPGTLNLFRLLGGTYPVHVADRIEQVALLADGTWHASDTWRLTEIPPDTIGVFSCVPTVNKGMLAAAVGATEAAGAVGEHLAALLQGFRPTNDAARAAGVPTIVLSHGTVYGSISEHGVPMAGFDHEFTTGTLFAARASAVMLGHIHKHQAWTDGGHVAAYAGSIGRLHHGEQGDKGFLAWHVTADSAAFELIVTPAKRTIDIIFQSAPNLDELKAAAASMDLDGAFVRVRWETPETERHEVDRKAITEILGAAADVKLEGRVIPVVTTRAAGISKAASIGDKLEAWARATNVSAAPLLDCLAALQCETPEQIAQRILASTGRPHAHLNEDRGEATFNINTTDQPTADVPQVELSLF